MPINGNLPDKWDKQADVVVIGFGAAGAAAAITAQDAGGVMASSDTLSGRVEPSARR